MNFQVPLTVDGNQFVLEFDPERTPGAQMANQFCTEQGPALGVTAETLPTCLDQVTRHIQTFVTRWIADRTLQVPVVVNGTQFDVVFLPERDDISVLAGRLCAADQLGLSPDMVGNCVNGVVNYLRRSSNDWTQEKTLRTSFTVSGLPFDVSFMPERESVQDVAKKLCVQYAANLGLTEETLASCIAPVAELLADRVNSWVRSKTLSSTINVNGQDYVVSFHPERETVASLARRVCLEKAEELQITNDNFAAKCFNPLVDYFNKEVSAWIESKRVTVRMSIGDEQLDAVVVPERESTSQVAQRICLQRADKLGLTTENFVAECVDPVNKLLVDGVNNWLAMRQRQAAQA